MRMVCQQRGFTLLELILVIFLIALSTAFIGSRLSSNVDRSVEQEARKFAATLNYVKEEAIVSSEPIAVFIDESRARYVFLKLGETDWEEVQNDDVLRPRVVKKPAEIKIIRLAKNTINRAGNNHQKNTEKKDKKNKENPYKNAPLVVADPLGRFQPFEVSFYFEDSDFRIKTDQDGYARVSKKADE